MHIRIVTYVALITLYVHKYVQKMYIAPSMFSKHACICYICNNQVCLHGKNKMMITLLWQHYQTLKKKLVGSSNCYNDKPVVCM